MPGDATNVPEPTAGPSPRARLTTGVLVSCAILAMALGAFGFHDRAVSRGWPSDIYKALQLFALEFDDLGTNTALNLARFLAAGVALFAAVVVARQLFGEQLDRAVLRRRRGHVVICGASAAGNALASAYRAQGSAVVVVDRSPRNRLPGRSSGAKRLLWVQGDPTDPSVLARAGVPAARVLIAASAREADNIPVAVAAATLPTASTRRSDAFILIQDEATHRLLAERSLLRPGALAHRGLHVQYVNLVDRGVRSLLSEHPPFRPNRHVDVERPHVVVVGSGPVAKALVLAIARMWRFVRPGARQLDVTLVAPSGADLIEQLEDEHADDVAACEFHQRPNLRGDATWLRKATNVFVCPGTGDEGLSASLLVHARAPGTNVVYIADALSARDADALISELGHGVADGRLRIFPLDDRTLTPLLIEHADTELLARAMHAAYVDELSVRGITSATERHPAACAWQELTTDLQDANRHQAADIDVKLAAVGCVRLPLAKRRSDPLHGFTDAEVELLAELEHERWITDRTAAGYVHGPVRSDGPDAKTHPDLVPWDRLNEQTRELDRQTVAQIPAFLARVGFGVYRLP